MLSCYCFSSEVQSLWIEQKVRKILCMHFGGEIQAAVGAADAQPKRCNLYLKPDRKSVV